MKPANLVGFFFCEHVLALPADQITNTDSSTGDWQKCIQRKVEFLLPFNVLE